MYHLSIKHVYKKFKNEAVLEDVNLEFSGGHIYGITGKNGTGKSVLFKIICGFIRADAGEVVADGKVIGRDADFPESLGAIIEVDIVPVNDPSDVTSYIYKHGVPPHCGK